MVSPTEIGPEKVDALDTFKLLTPVISLELASKLPPSVGVVSPKISVVIPVRLVNGYPVASCKSNAGVASAAPKATDTPPKETLELDNLSLAIEPVSYTHLTLPTICSV